MKKKKIPEWKVTEQVTAILEKFITPDSKVQHNVLLPVVGRPERKPRQCDVVITFGTSPRQTVSIVEVQKRNKKPDIITFHGWYNKMVEVGAQQLICVSKLGYPKSIIDEVKNKYGNTVVLMTLEEFDFLKNPEKVNILPYNIILSPKFDFGEMDRMMLTQKVDSDAYNLNTLEKCFSEGNETATRAINEVVGQWLHRKFTLLELNQIHESKNKAIIEFKITKDTKLYFHYKNEKILISQWGFSVHMEVDKEIQPTSVKHYKYSQQFSNGSIAWIASTQITVNNVEHKLDIIFKPNSAGHIEINSVLRE